MAELLERNETRKIVALSLVATATVCLVGAFRLPFMHSEFSLELPGWMPDPIASRVRLWLIDRGRIPVGDHYLWGVIRKLFTAREYFLGWAILLFSVVVPVLKIALCTTLIHGESLLSRRSRNGLHWYLMHIGKWSMADVFIVGMIIVFFKAEGFHYTFRAGPGIYCYGSSALLSAVAVGIAGRTLQPAQPSPQLQEEESASVFESS